MNKTAVTIIVGIVVCLGLLMVGFIAFAFFTFNEVKKESTETVETFADNEVTETTETVEMEPVEIEEEAKLDSLPNAEEEAAKWNDTATEFIAMYSEYKMDPSNIKKDEMNSTVDVTTFVHEFKTPLKISVQYTLNNETEEITEMKLVGHEIARADRSAIFHAMCMFISYVDSEVSTIQAGEYLGTIPFATDTNGVYEEEFNGKRYDYILDLNEGTNTLIYRVGE
jgi:inosine/xanthosine triphosphate pyrophosphatase family protein